MPLTTLYAKKSSKDYIQQAKKDLPKECIFFFKMYLNAKEPKAFAYAVDSRSKYTCRFSSASENEKKAKKVALKSCEKSRQKRGIKSECKLYNIDIRGFVSKKGKDFRNKYRASLQKIEQELKKVKEKIEKKNFDNNLKEKKKVDKKEALKAIKNSKLSKINTKLNNNNLKKIDKKLEKLPKPCQMFYKLYLLSPANKAFCIAIDSDKKYVCKFSANSNTATKAKEVAINSCKKSKKKRGVHKECTIYDLIAKPKQNIYKKSKKTKTFIAKNDKFKKKTKTRNLTSLDKKLQEAILDANLKKIKKLIKDGADINVVAKDHSRALFVATAKGDIEYVKELLQKGANPFFTKGDGNNLLVAAIMSGKLEMLKLILEQGVDPNEQCNEGNTPLHFAFMMFDDKMMKELYKNGASDEIPNDKGETVRSMAKVYHVNLNKLKREHF